MAGKRELLLLIVNSLLVEMKYLIIFFAVFFSLNISAQDLSFGRKIVDTLTSPVFWGRGYTKNGMAKAAGFISASLKSYGLEPMSGNSYFQPFSYPVNTFPGKMQLSVNGSTLIAGKDFIVDPASNGFRGAGKLVMKDSTRYTGKGKKILFKLADKLTWSVASVASDTCKIILDKKKYVQPPSYFTANIENRIIPHFQADNICAIVKGTRVPDSFILITAHYDHLGGMGAETYFPGANDNASGIALLMNIARYYAAHPQPYSIGFICFAGEEAGLIGSRYFTENPLISLDKVRFLVNTDLAGTGEEGITVVNATEYPYEFEVMNTINKENNLLSRINPRGKAANSDHYFFSLKGVPSFFFYTMGGIKAYHDVFDRAETLPLNEHEDLFKLIILFNKKLMGD